MVARVTTMGPPAVNPPQPRKNPLPHLTNKLIPDSPPASPSVGDLPAQQIRAGPSCRRETAAGAIADNFDLFIGLVDALEFSIIDRLAAHLCEKQHGKRCVEITKG